METILIISAGILASATSHTDMHWKVPRSTNDLFTGRTEILRRIQEALHGIHTPSADKQKRFVITGVGGQGKSEVCLQVASLVREQ
jgi:phage/plasmid-associated DNA primase